MTRTVAPARTGFAFSVSWSGLTLADAFERIRTSMPREDPERLTPRQQIDVLVHTIRVGQFPAGMIERPRHMQALGQIRHTSMEP